MKKIARVLFDTWYGAVAACAVSAAGVVAGTLFGAWTAGRIAVVVFGGLLLLSGLVLVAAFVRSLWKRAWGRAAAQLVLGLVGAVGFGLASVAATLLATHGGFAFGLRPPWVGADEKNGVVPFEVEYRRGPALGAEYDRRVAFASGKHVGIARDTGGHAALAVYALEDGAYALMDSAGFLFRVDAASETVDAEHGKRWFRLPEGTEEVKGWRVFGLSVVLENGERQSIKDGVPVGTSLDGHRLLGQFVPDGRFVEEAEDWLTEKLTPVPWMPLPKWPEDFPFAVEQQKEQYNRFEGFVRWRVAFPSGKAVALGPMWDTPYSVQEMADGNYALKSEREMEPPFSPTTYRVRVGDECVDFRIDDDWVEIPAEILEVTSWGTRGVFGRNADNERVCGTNWVPMGATMEGMRLVGWMTEDREFAWAGEPTGDGEGGEMGVEGE